MDVSWPHWIALSSVIMTLLGAGVWWLLEQGTRGAEIATVLALVVAVIALLVTLVALLVTLAEKLGMFDRPRPPDKPPPSRPPAVVRLARAVVDWIGKHVLIVVGLFLVLSLIATSRFWAPPLRILVAGCEHATELRVLTSPEQLEPARLLADRYQHSAQRSGCASVHLYVFALPTKQVREALAAAHWPDSALRAAPQPDVWLADSAREVAKVRTALASVEGGIIAEDVPVAWSPIVLGGPAATADELHGRLPGHPWTELFQATTHLNWDVVRPDPANSPAGESGTALLYGGGTVIDPALAHLIEQRLGVSLDRDKYPLGGSLDVLCRYRQLDGPRRTAVVISEQALVRFNHGDPLGDTCATPTGQRGVDDLLLAYYPSDTRSLDFQFVRFGWSAPAQRDAAVAFGKWLTGEDGAQALKDVGLRPRGFTAGGLLTPRNGMQPATFIRDPVPNGVLDAAMAAHRTAQRRTRVLLALDSSGSMSALAGAGQGSRFDAASRGVVGALKLMGEQDEFGLSVFPADPAGSEIRQEVVTIGPRDGLVGTRPRRLATKAALSDIRPAGNTPLYRAIADGVDRVAAAGPSDETYSNALVVLTDGKDTTSGLTDAQVIDEVSDKGVRVFVIAVGEASCATVVLRDVTTNTGGRCLDADLSSIDAKLAELFGVLWSEG